MTRFGGLGMLAGGFIGLIVAVVITVLAVLAIIALIRYINTPGRHHGHGSPTPANTTSNENGALKILDERFAKGEIDEEEFTRKKEMLKK